MVLSRVAILAIRGSDTDFKDRLAKALGVTKLTAYQYIRDNDDTLTKAAAMELIRELTGLSDDQILETEKVES